MASRKGPPFSADEAETITPEKVAWAAGSKRSGATRPYVWKTVAVVFALVAVLIGGGFLLRYLSKNPIYVVPVPGENATKQPETEKIPVEAPPPASQAPRARAEATVEAPAAAPTLPGTQEEPKPVDPAQLALEKSNSERELEVFLGAKRGLDGKGGAEWGGGRYAEMVKLGQAADAHFVDQKYPSATAKYRQATAVANELLAESGAVLRRMIEEGGVALAAENGALARRKFRIASLIDPSNEFARRSLEQAETAEAVGRLIASGKSHEQGDNLSFAYADYQQALKLDPESPGARAAVGRVKGKIAEGQFQELMSKGLTAYHNHEYEVARATLLRARSFHPDSREVADALAQVDQGIRLARMEELRKGALAAEKSEDWEQALQHHTDVLEIDPAIQFALEGSRAGSVPWSRSGSRSAFVSTWKNRRCWNPTANCRMRSSW
jgi:tetratricopeptide (TPR) repeat protein